ncbi:entericidin [Rhizobium sp. RAF56]|jgi:predicted small secreted protein
MSKTVATFLLALLSLTSCANTFKGMTQDAKDTGMALDQSGRKVLKASSN